MIDRQPHLGPDGRAGRTSTARCHSRLHSKPNQNISLLWLPSDQSQSEWARSTVGQEAFHLADGEAAKGVHTHRLYSAHMSLRRHWQDKRTVNKLITSLNDLGTTISVTLRWVKAHTNGEGKNVADRIAKIRACPNQAALDGFPVEDILDLPVSYSNSKTWSTR